MPRYAGGYKAGKSLPLVRQNYMETVAVIRSLRLVNAAVEPLERLCAWGVLGYQRKR
jgi:hypothetical protein